MGTEAALQLNENTVTTTGQDLALHFSNFPGLWKIGQPIAIGELGFATADEALAAANEAGVPLDLVDVEHGSAPMPVRDNHVANDEQARAVDLAMGKGGFRTHADADAAAAAAGVEWPVAKMTLSEKTEFLATYAQGTVDEDGTGEGEG